MKARGRRRSFSKRNHEVHELKRRDKPVLPKHDFQGAFCSACGVDEASSFADQPCAGFEAAL